MSLVIKIVWLPKLSMRIRKIILTAFTLTLLFQLLAVGVIAQEADPIPSGRVRYITAPVEKPKAIELTNNPPKRSLSLEKSDVISLDEAKFLEKEAFDLINLKRLERGLSELVWNERLAEVARLHSENMAKNGFFSHFGLNGSLVDSRATDLGINGWRAIGENIAYNQGVENPSGFAVQRWMGSDGHKRNLLDRRWVESGLGVAVTKDGKYFFTQVFLLNK